MVKVDIISGFLGAGKTTLIQKLLKTVYRNQNVVLIENEFGEIGIDGGFLKEAGIEIKEMNSGCICCSLVGDFSKSLKEVVETYHPERIIIEPSGVGKLSDVMRAVDGVKDEVDLEIGYRITVLDVNKCKMYLKNFGEFYVNQIEYASTIVFSRTDIAKEGKTDAALAIVKEHNADAAIVTTPVEQLNEESLLAALNHTTGLEEMLRRAEEEHEKEHHHHDHDGECCCGHHHEHGHHHADDVFTSWGVETAHKFTEEELKDIVSKLASDKSFGEVLRAKGIVASDEGEWFHFDLVPEETELRRGAADYTGRICVIGSNLNEAAIKELFHVA